MYDDSLSRVLDWCSPVIRLLATLPVAGSGFVFFPLLR
jgi:hypothetical protein